MSALLEIRDFSLDIDTFDGVVHVLRNIDLDVHRGETLGIVGESGSGKTILVRSILGIGPKMSRVVSGGLRFDGRDLAMMDDAGWAEIRGIRISMVFQDPMTFLNPLFSIERQIGDVLAAHRRAARKPVPNRRQRRDRAEELLDQVGLPDPSRVCDQYPHQLSGGMRQRVLIALALTGEPDILIADEPTTALDVTVQAQVLDLINTLVERLGLTVIMISHDVGAIATVARRCAVMYRGEIVEQGETRRILTAPRHPYTRRLLDAVPEMDPPATAASAPAAPAAIETGAKENALVEVEGLTKVFGAGAGGQVRAVDAVSFSIAPGEILGIVGESGSGKSTVARLLLRLIEPTAGAVRFDGTELTGLAREPLRRLRRDMQLVFQNPHSALNGRHTIGEAIGEPFRIQGRMGRQARERRVEELLDIVQLPRLFKYRYPHELSGGQKQRVCIARAVALNPRLLVLDEPTSALDVSVQGQILEFLEQLRREMALTYLFISHDLAVINALCDRVLVMRRGKIVEANLAADLFRDPRHPYTQSLLESGRKTSKSALTAHDGGSGDLNGRSR